MTLRVLGVKFSGVFSNRLYQKTVALTTTLNRHNCGINPAIKVENMQLLGNLQSRLMSQWHLVSAVCLERKPRISSEMKPIEKEFSSMLQQIEDENSLLSDHEVKHLEDLRIKEKIKKGELEEGDVDATTRQAAAEFEELSAKELKEFTPASRKTEADAKDDKKSLLRRLDSSLILVTQLKLGNDKKWMFPQGIRKGEETMRQAAERVIRELCGDTMKILFMGNCPAGYYKYKYPKAARKEDGIIGAKVFFFKAQIREGDICSETMKENKETEDFLWLTRSEMKEKLHSDYCKAVEHFLVDDL